MRSRLSILGNAKEGYWHSTGRKSERGTHCGAFDGSTRAKIIRVRGEKTAEPSGFHSWKTRWEQGRENKGFKSFRRAALRNCKESRRTALVAFAVIDSGDQLEDCTNFAQPLDRQEMSSVFSQIQKEIHQDHSLRKPYLKKIRDLRDGRAVVSFFITFYGDYPLSQNDDDMIEEILGNTDCSKGISLILDAPGGDALAAERMISICRNYSKGDFEAIVPARAKSAATMVCLGADRILMSPTSELGPVDPQVYSGSGPTGHWVAAHYMVKAYDELFSAAVALQGGQIEPYLQQLSKFNAVQITELRAARDLSENIAISSLKRGMLKHKSETEIKALIEPFINPEITMSHGRALNHERARDCELTVELLPLDSELWKNIWALYTRANYAVDAMNIAKLVETVENSYSVSR